MIIATIQGSYVDNFGNDINYRYHIHDTDSLDWVKHLLTYEQSHNPKQTIVWKDNNYKHMLKDMIKNV